MERPKHQAATATERPTPSETKPEKISLGIDYDRRGYIEGRVTDFCEFVNARVYPLAASLDLPTDRAALIAYAENSDNLRAAYVAKYKADRLRANESPYLAEVAEKNALARWEAEFNAAPYDDEKPRYPQFVVTSEAGGLVADLAAITDYCTTYVKPYQMGAYRRHHAAADALNALYNGKAPTNGLGRAFYALDGIVYPSQNVDYDFFCKPGELPTADTDTTPEP